MPTVEDKAIVIEPMKDEKADGVCAVCPHDWAGHDAIGVRYCSATIANELDRGCICRT
jgi:hypothetical protein